jgi:DNA-binding beta-propeller fold protein YncE
VGTHPYGIAIAPNGLFALVANNGSNSVSPINLSNPMVPTKGTDLTVGATPYSPGPNCIYFR